MTVKRRTSFSPTLVVALAALFFSLGGSAFALGNHLAAAQPRCANGAVRGIATIVGNPSAGIANIGDQFTSNKAVFSRRFNCTGGAVQVRRVATGLYEIRFLRNTAQTAMASAVGDSYANVELEGGGVFKVSVHPAGRDDLSDTPFSIVVV